LNKMNMNIQDIGLVYIQKQQLLPELLLIGKQYVVNVLQHSSGVLR